MTRLADGRIGEDAAAGPVACAEIRTMRVRGGWRLGAAVGAALLAGGAHGREEPVSAPAGVTLHIYDVGVAQVAELRRAALAPGVNVLVLTGLPHGLDPSSVRLHAAAGVLNLVEQRFAFDLRDADSLFRRFLGGEVQVVTPSGRYEGRLLSAPARSGSLRPDVPLALGQADGRAVLFLGADQLHQVVFPAAAGRAYLEPTLIGRVETALAGPQSLRLGYLTEGLSWSAAYDLVLPQEGADAYLGGRVGLHNRSGGRFESARVQLVATERGAAPDPLDRLAGSGAAGGERGRAPGPLRYGRGEGEPVFARLAAGLHPRARHDLPDRVTLEDGETVHVRLVAAEAVPVRTVHVYDGVRFDRFQRARRDDPAYGTEYDATVDLHVAFDNEDRHGLGRPLPAGRIRVYREGDGFSDLIGEDWLGAVAAGGEARALIGAARALRGERLRTAYAEVQPLRVYDESFEIRLTNGGGAAAEVRVVEHLYRSADHEILKSDAEYTATGPQRIEFRMRVPASGQTAIRYTVRYRWP